MEAGATVVFVDSLAFQGLGVVAEGCSCKFTTAGGATGLGLDVGTHWAFKNGAGASVYNEGGLARCAIFLAWACAVETDAVTAEAVVENIVVIVFAVAGGAV